MDMLLCASFCKRSTLIRNIEVELEAGELCYSQKSLAKRWKWNERTVAKFLKFLEKHQMIQYRMTHVTTIITIINWDEYNGITSPSTQENVVPLTSPDTHGVQSGVQTNKEYINNGNNNNSENFENVNKVVNSSVDNSQGMQGKAVIKGRKIFGFETNLHVGDKLEGEL